MKTITYNEIPKLSKWKEDSKVRDIFVTRKSDPILSRIDNILQAIENSKDQGEALYLRFELFYATNFWLNRIKHHHRMLKMHTGREPAMWALFRCNANGLAATFEVGSQALVNTLEKYFGRTLSKHGQEKDVKSFHYFRKQAEREKFKLFYKNGLLYQLPWRKILDGTPIRSVKPVKASSSLIHEQTSKSLKGTMGPADNFMALLKEDWAFYVMSVDRELYVEPHIEKLGEKSTLAGQIPKFHSSLLAGMPVASAGSILIEKGVVRGIRNDSGHYQPTNLHQLNILQQFLMMNVPLNQITVFDYADSVRAQGDEFLAGLGNWKNIRLRMLRGDPVRRAFEVDVKVRFKNGKGESFRTLVRSRYNSLKEKNPQGAQLDVWAQAYQEVALALGELDDKWWKMASSPPIPFSPHGPKPPPRIPGKANRPKAAHRNRRHVV